MKLSLFDYSFPKELVAQRPLPRREASRMLVLDRKTGTWEHRHFMNFSDYLRPGDLLILNNAQADLVEVEGRPVPALPPYIKRRHAEDFTEEDFKRYRTVYASVPGSKAAPTAGFHFSEESLKKITAAGAEIAFLTLHVSYDTYKPIRSEEIEDHPMHGEKFEIPETTLQKIQDTKKHGGRLIAVGTTVVRALESWANDIRGTTRLFITPGFKFQMIDVLLTNFHRPRSTVLVMVSSFAGRELVLSAYEEALREKYRLFSYGDCMLII